MTPPIAPAAVIATSDVRVVFYRDRDRYAHRIESLDPATGDWRPEWQSVEGTPDDVWPPSPPLQQLHLEERPTGPVALLVGMAGRTHWSAAVEIVHEAGASGEPRTPCIRFEIAARLHAVDPTKSPAEPRRLTSTYRRLAKQGRGAVTIRPLDGSDDSPESPPDLDQIVFDGWCGKPDDPATPQTILWRYRLTAARTNPPAGLS